MDRGIDRATVYRTLSLLKHCGLIDELEMAVEVGGNVTETRSHLGERDHDVRVVAVQPQRGELGFCGVG